MINPDDMIPIELMMLKTGRGLYHFSPSEFKAQYLEIADRASWALHRAHAMGQGVELAGYLWMRGKV